MPNSEDTSDEGRVLAEGEVTVTRQDINEARDTAASGKRVQKSFYITAEIYDRAIAAVYWSRPYALAQGQMSGEEIDVESLPDSASALVESSLWAEVLRLERLYHKGEPFPAVKKLRSGPGQRGIDRLSQSREKPSPSPDPPTSTGWPQG